MNANKKYVLIIIIVLLVQSLRAQDSNGSFKSFQSLAIGFDGYLGYEKFSNAFSWKSNSDNLLMRNANIPFISVMHFLSPKLFASLKVGYAFMRSTNYIGEDNSTMYSCSRKLGDIKMDIKANYFIISTKSFAILVSGEIGVNFIKEKIECHDDINYTKFGYGLGAGFMINNGIYMGLIFILNYYRISDSILIGTGVEMPIFSNRKK